MDSSETLCIRMHANAQQLAEARRPPGPSEGRRTPLPLLHHVTTFNPTPRKLLSLHFRSFLMFPNLIIQLFSNPRLPFLLSSPPSKPPSLLSFLCLPIPPIPHHLNLHVIAYSHIHHLPTNPKKKEKEKEKKKIPEKNIKIKIRRNHYASKLKILIAKIPPRPPKLSPNPPQDPMPTISTPYRPPKLGFPKNSTTLNSPTAETLPRLQIASKTRPLAHTMPIQSPLPRLGFHLPAPQIDETQTPSQAKHYIFSPRPPACSH